MTIRAQPPKAVILRSSAAFLLTLVLTLTAGCGDQEPGASPSPFLHVHGQGVNPADQKLYAATHSGVFAI